MALPPAAINRARAPWQLQSRRAGETHGPYASPYAELYYERGTSGIWIRGNLRGETTVTVGLSHLRQRLERPPEPEPGAIRGASCCLTANCPTALFPIPAWMGCRPAARSAGGAGAAVPWPSAGLTLNRMAGQPVRIAVLPNARVVLAGRPGRARAARRRGPHRRHQRRVPDSVPSIRRAGSWPLAVLPLAAGGWHGGVDQARFREQYQRRRFEQRTPVEIEIAGAPQWLELDWGFIDNPPAPPRVVAVVHDKTERMQVERRAACGQRIPFQRHPMGQGTRRQRRARQRRQEPVPGQRQP